LLTSDYVLNEVNKNLPKLPASATANWLQLRDQLAQVEDVLTIDWAVVFEPAKDRPILFTALAWSEALLTLDRDDFGKLLGGTFYGLPLLTPGDFLERERAATRLG
jgi:hypothetical protein